MTQNGQTSEILGRWWALAALALSMLTLGLDATVLNVALPTLATELDASTSQLQWFGAAYTLVLGALMIPMGSLGDRLGRKRVLLAGLAVFGAASAACAFASSAGVLIAARAVQGIGGAAMMPLSMAMLPVLFQDRDERTRAMNIWVTCSAIGLPLGPIVGGWLLDHFGWGCGVPDQRPAGRGRPAGPVGLPARVAQRRGRSPSTSPASCCRRPAWSP